MSTMLIGRAVNFPSYFFVSHLFFQGLPVFPRGNLGRRMVEESTKIQDTDRFVKKHCLLSLFSFSTSFRSTCLSKLSKDPFHHFSILLPPGSPSTTLADPSWQRWPPESSRIHKDPNWIGPGRLLEWWVVLGLIQSHVFSHPRSFPTPIQKTTILLSSTFSFITEGEEGGMMCNHTTWELISDCFMEMFNLPRNGKVHLIKRPV